MHRWGNVAFDHDGRPGSLFNLPKRSGGRTGVLRQPGGRCIGEIFSMAEGEYDKGYPGSRNREKRCDAKDEQQYFLHSADFWKRQILNTMRKQNCRAKKRCDCGSEPHLEQ